MQENNVGTVTVTQWKMLLAEQAQGGVSGKEGKVPSPGVVELDIGGRG